MSIDLEARLQACERGNRRLRIALAALAVACFVSTFVVALGAATASGIAAQTPAGTLRVSELVVVNPAGVERVRIGGNLPDAVIDGKRIDRGSRTAGVMLYDRSGQERGGYVTFDTGDNIALTLDGRKGQNALFATGPDGSTVVQIWHGAQSIELRADENGARLSQTRAGRLALQQPEVTALGAGTCTLFRDGLRSEVPDGVPMEQVRAICERRFAASACGACLDRE